MPFSRTDERDLEEWLARGVRELSLVPLHKEPLRPRIGLIVYADGTDWDPSGGEGLYVYDGSTWNKL